MGYILIIFWWGPIVAQQTSINFSSLSSCNDAKIEIRKNREFRATNLEMFCVKK